MRLKTYVAWDLEWNPDTFEILSAAFVDDSGKEYVYHVSDFPNGEFGLVRMIKMILLRYPVNIGFYSTGSNSDIHVLNTAFMRLGITSIINEDKLIAEPFPGRKHIDLYRVFDKLMVKGNIYNNAYKSMKLHDIAMALLGEGKTGKGRDAIKLHNEGRIEELKEYNLQDARLTMKLSKVGKIDDKTGKCVLNGELLDLMMSIGDKIGMNFEHVCHYGITTLWAHVFDHEEDAPPPRPEYAQIEDYEGALILDPEAGYYEDVIVVDVTSLYPTMAINHNLSYETVCCQCCKNDPKARVPADIDSSGYWICQRRKGIFVRKLEQYKADRVKEKRAGNEVASTGLKIMINGGYGAFGNEHFKYASLPVAKLIPAFGRWVLRTMISLAQRHGFKVIYGDTDSLFLIKDSEKAELVEFIAEAEQTLKISLEHEKTFKWLFLIGKKHYFGETTKGKIIIKGMEGKKDDRPEWIRETFEQFIHDKKTGCDPLVLLQASWDMFRKGELPLEKLRYTVKLSKNPEDYEESNLNRKLGFLAGARAGDVVYYWKVRDGVAVEGVKFEDLDKKAYEETFTTTFEEILKIMGKSIKEITEGQCSLIHFFR